MSRISSSGALGLALAALLPAMPVAPVAAQEVAAAQVVLPTDRTVLPIPEPAVPAQHRARRPQCEAAAAVRGQGAGRRAQRAHRADRRHGLRPVQRLRRARSTCRRWSAWPTSGLRYNQFHTTALCSPTRAALLTGRNHHMSNMGSITETATAFPGQTGQRPNSVAPLAEMLRLNGYSTAAFGKSHETAAWEVSPSGPTDRWPTRSGFDKFYGFIGGETNQWAPLLYDGMTQVEPPKDPNYHFMTDMTDQAIDWMQVPRSRSRRTSRSSSTSRPGATHAPHHVPKEWIAKYKGKFDQGWDKLREETLARQIKLGVVPAGHQARAQAGGDQGLGQADAPTRRSSSPARWRSSPASASTPTTRSAGWSRPSRTWASSTTR